MANPLRNTKGKTWKHDDVPSSSSPPVGGDLEEDQEEVVYELLHVPFPRDENINHANDVDDDESNIPWCSIINDPRGEDGNNDGDTDPAALEDTPQLPDTEEYTEEVANEDDARVEDGPVPNDSDGVPANAFFPRWGRSTRALHKDLHRNQGQKTSTRGLAGFPDFLYCRSPSGLDYGAIGKGKTRWAVPDQVFEQFCTYGFAPNGIVNWGYSTTANTVLRQVRIALYFGHFLVLSFGQIWGELNAFPTQWGFLTNGSKILLFAKPGLRSQTLIFSEVLDWTQDDLYLGMAGFTFAVQDTLDIRENTQGPRGNIAQGRINLVDIICPPRDRTSNFPRPENL